MLLFGCLLHPPTKQHPHLYHVSHTPTDARPLPFLQSHSHPPHARGEATGGEGGGEGVKGTKLGEMYQCWLIILDGRMWRGVVFFKHENILSMLIDQEGYGMRCNDKLENLNQSLGISFSSNVSYSLPDWSPPNCSIFWRVYLVINHPVTFAVARAFPEPVCEYK